MTPLALVNIGTCNGMLPNGTNPLPEPMMTYHQHWLILRNLPKGNNTENTHERNHPNMHMWKSHIWKIKPAGPTFTNNV